MSLNHSFVRMKTPLDYIFIDTCIFKSSSFFKDEGVISRLFNYAEQGMLNILMPEITKREWFKHYKKACSLKFDTADNKAALMGNTVEIDDFVKAYQKFIGKYNPIVESVFEKHLERARVINIPTEYAGDLIGDVFDKYFAVEKPFGSDGKSKEFPDAFVLASLEKYAKENGIKRIVILSTDKDLTEYKSSVIQAEDVTNYLNELVKTRIPEQKKLKADEDINRISSYIQELPNDKIRYISGKIEEYLSDVTLYEERFDYVDIDEAYVGKVDVEPTAKDMQVLEVDDETIRVAFFAEFNTKVNVRHFSEEDSVWDSEEKDWAYKEYKNTEIEVGTALKVFLELDRTESDEGQNLKIEITGFDFDELREYVVDTRSSRVENNAPWKNYATRAAINPLSSTLSQISQLATMAKPPQSIATALSSFKAFQEQINLPETQKHLAQMAAISGSLSATIQSIQQATKPNILESVNSLSAVIESMVRNEKK